MSDMLPIVEELADCQNHTERAAWLMRCPNFIFHREHLMLRRILQAAGLLAGVAYVEAKFAEQVATRLPDGTTPITILSAVYIAETDLKISARQEGAI
ncbi:hypothetical protein G6K84_03705 [Agrobacterium rhizogenes]|nr:hypothetical protein [Rhizobium rhizogenes]